MWKLMEDDVWTPIMVAGGVLIAGNILRIITMKILVRQLSLDAN
jgi:hypothetical protein